VYVFLFISIAVHHTVSLSMEVE